MPTPIGRMLTSRASQRSCVQDPFAKIKDLIRDMIQKLQGEAEAEAQEKEYCDEQLSKTKEKKGELEDDIAKMTADIDSAASKSAQLKDEVKARSAHATATCVALHV